ncbi:MAG: hypothetical protein MUC50_18530 [Myxococcota bacterium]|jgi:DNA-binding NarL/FixJ family response regulator|nr:hypothetical protein [Myxococcota bacterium]
MENPSRHSEARPTVLLCGTKAGQWRDAMVNAGFDVRLGIHGPWRKMIAETAPRLLVVHEIGLGVGRAVVELRNLKEARQLPLIVMLDDNEEHNDQRFCALDAGADEVLSERQGGGALVKAASLLVGTMFPAEQERPPQDAVARALEIAAAVGKSSAEDEEDTAPKLLLSSSIVQVIDMAQKSYAQEHERRPDRREIRANRAHSAAVAFCGVLGVPSSATVSQLKRAASSLLDDLDAVTNLGYPELALCLAAQSVLRMDERP